MLGQFIVASDMAEQQCYAPNELTEAYSSQMCSFCFTQFNIRRSGLMDWRLMKNVVTKNERQVEKVT